MFCVSCGAELDDGTQFCPFCGKRVGRPARPTTRVEESAGNAAAASPTVASASDSGTASPDATVYLSGYDAQGGLGQAEQSASEAQGFASSNAREATYDADATRFTPAPYADVAPAPVRPVDAAQPAARTAPGDTASFTAPLPPSIPQDGIMYNAHPARKRTAGESVLIGLAVVVVLAAVVCGAWVLTGHTLPFLAPTQAEQPAPADDASSLADLTPLTVTISTVNADSYPTVAVDLALTAADGSAFDASSLTAADFGVTETTSNVNRAIATVDRFTPGNGGTSRLVYTSAIDAADAGAEGARTVEVTLDQLSGYAGSSSTEVYVAPDASDAEEQDASDSQAAQEAAAAAAADPAGYLLPDSGTHRYTADELEGYSDWDLYVARNEIFARYGRGFSSADLQAYFNGKTWYREQYAPEEFDSMASPLNEVEKANVETIRSVEQSRGSSYA